MQMQLKSPGKLETPLIIAALFGVGLSILRYVKGSEGDSLDWFIKIPQAAKTPLNLAALVVVVLFAIYKMLLRSEGPARELASKIPDNVATYLFVLALVAIVLALTRPAPANPSPSVTNAPGGARLYGKVHSPPSDSTQGVPNAVVYVDVGHTYRVVTDGLGDFSFEVPVGDMGREAKIWAKAEGFEHSDVQTVKLSPSEEKVYIPLRTVTKGSESARTRGESSIHFSAGCLNGDWREQPTGKALWSFDLHGDVLNARRHDGNVTGAFKLTGNDWKGSLVWGNGERWENVVLSPTRSCKEIYTNQSWWYEKTDATGSGSNNKSDSMVGGKSPPPWEQVHQDLVTFYQHEIAVEIARSGTPQCDAAPRDGGVCRQYAFVTLQGADKTQTCREVKAVYTLSGKKWQFGGVTPSNEGCSN
jgi:hypothetical protein